MQEQLSDNGEMRDRHKGRVDWNNPGVPCGNSPPLPRWPIALAATAWVAWIGFLVAMVAFALRSPRV